MWLFASTIILCFTVVVMFFLFGKLLESKWRHERLVQNDIHQNAKYTAITQRPAPRAAMPDFRPARTIGTHRHSSEPFIDPRMTELMQAHYYTEEARPVPILHELREAERLIKKRNTPRRTL